MFSHLFTGAQTLSQMHEGYLRLFTFYLVKHTQFLNMFNVKIHVGLYLFKELNKS